MTKEKIIDGVKVEECSYYNKDNTPYCCEVWDNECEAQNCYFKQCERLEQENERLKEELNKYEERYEELYKNSEQLVKKYNKYDGKKENELIEVINKTTDLKNKYKYTLQEIKEIVSESCLDDENCITCNSNCPNKDILKLIKKAEEE